MLRKQKMKTKSQKEPQKLDFSMVAPKGYKNTLDENMKKRNTRREKLNKLFNKEVKDTF